MDKTQIVLISGFLGAGKTSLMKHLLTELGGLNQGLSESTNTGEKNTTKNTSAESTKAEQKEQNSDHSTPIKIGVIVNEFGKVSIDGTILSQFEAHITELNNGSVFCQCLAGTFIDKIVQMLSLDLDYLFIESTGLADPSNMRDMMRLVRNKTDRPYTYAGVLCIVDARNFRKLSQSLEMIKRQILHSTLIVLNKTDLVDPDELAAVKQAIKKINPMAHIFPTTYGKLPVEELAGLHGSRLGKNLSSLNTPSARSKTILLQFAEPVGESSLKHFFAALQGRAYRLKGFVRLVDHPGHWQVDVVGQEANLVPAKVLPDRDEIVILPYSNEDLQLEIAGLIESVFGGVTSGVQLS